MKDTSEIGTYRVVRLGEFLRDGRTWMLDSQQDETIGLFDPGTSTWFLKNSNNSNLQLRDVLTESVGTIPASFRVFAGVFAPANSIAGSTPGGIAPANALLSDSSALHSSHRSLSLVDDLMAQTQNWLMMDVDAGGTAASVRK